MKEEFLKLLRSTNRENIEDLIEFITKTDFFEAPASTRFHGAREHGLLEHKTPRADARDESLSEPPEA